MTWNHLSIIKGVSEGRMVRYPIQRHEPLRVELEAFTSAVLNDTPMPVSGADGLVALRLALALIESNTKHGVIDIKHE